MSAGIIVFITHDPAIEDIADEILRVDPVATGAGEPT
jgi:ABC-type lipoprotein export system ATPase subunit